MNIYEIAAIISVLEIICLLLGNHKKLSQELLIFFFCGAISCFGYAVMSRSTSFSTMMVGNQIYYIGGLNCSIFLALTVAQICKRKIHPAVVTTLFIIEIVILWFVFNVLETDWYYKELAISRAYGVYFLKKTRGPAYALTAIELIGCNVIAIVTVLKSLKNRFEFSKNTAMLLLSTGVASTIIFFIPRIIGLKIDVTVFAYVIDMAIILVIYERSDLYDMSENLLKIVDERREFGYICFDSKKRFLGCTESMTHPVPQLKDQVIDRKIDVSLFTKDMPIEVTKWIESYIDDKSSVLIERQFEQDGRYWIGKIHEFGFGLSKGYFIEFRENSRDMQYIREIEKAKEIAEDAMERDRIMRHDRRHFEGMLYALLEEGKSEDAMRLLSERLAHEPHGFKKICENRPINATLSHYQQIAEKKDVPIKIDADIPETIGVDDMELAITIGNLVENAILAAEKVPREERYVHFTAKYKKQLLIEVDNSYKGIVEFDSKGYPTTSTKGHGIGSKSVLYFVNKSGSDIFYDAADGRFNVRLIVNE